MNLAKTTTAYRIIPIRNCWPETNWMDYIHELKGDINLAPYSYFNSVSPIRPCDVCEQ